MAAVTKLSPEEKHKAIEDVGALIRGGDATRVACEKVGIPYSSYKFWTKPKAKAAVQQHTLVIADNASEIAEIKLLFKLLSEKIARL